MFFQLYDIPPPKLVGTVPHCDCRTLRVYSLTLCIFLGMVANEYGMCNEFYE